ncbi:hypothetical protein [Enemella sp. A6]|uniref:hypothetical protein n=1 Tax=Enemella sp. A6 TaxID=3440152 RepID=UPI003EB6F765
MTVPHLTSRAWSLLIGMLVLLSAGCAPTDAGEPLTDRTFETFTAHGESSQYHLFAEGLSDDTPLGLVLYFHGDGAEEFDHPDDPDCLGGPDGVVSVARERGFVTVAVRTPDTDTLTWWESGATNSEYVAALVERITNQYRIDPHRVWLVGYSGGAQFITQHYLPTRSDTISGGGAVLFGGGGRPDNVDEDPYADALKQHFDMFWYTGADDDGTDSTDGYDALGDPVHGARAGLAHYAGLGFRTGHEWPADTGHDLSGRFGPVLASRLDAAG